MEERREKYETFSEGNPDPCSSIRVAGLGLTAGGAAMGATMGDVSVLDHGITQVLRILDHEDSWEVEDSEEDMDEQEDDFQADAERAVTEKGILADSADSSAYTKVYEASAVSDLSCNLRYEELVLKTWNEDKVQVKVSGRITIAFRSAMTTAV